MMDKGLTEKIIGAAMEVHQYWGPGLMESTYEKSLAHELMIRGINVQAQIPLRLKYKDLMLSDDFRLDLLVEGKIIVELKAVKELAPIHEAQLLTYLRLSNCHIGLLINFNVIKLRDGIKRLAI
jgi:GxxExxY protein